MTFGFRVEKTMYTDSVFFVMSNGKQPPPGGYINGTSPPGNARCMVRSPSALPSWGTFRSPLAMNATGSFDLNAFCALPSGCPASLVRDCNFTSGVVAAPGGGRRMLASNALSCVPRSARAAACAGC